MKFHSSNSSRKLARTHAPARIKNTHKIIKSFILKSGANYRSFKVDLKYVRHAMLFHLGASCTGIIDLGETLDVR